MIAIEQKRIINLIAFIFLAAYLLPYWIMGEDGHFLIWDNLDSLMTWLKIASQDKYIFSSSQRMLDELDFVKRSSIQSETDLNFWNVYFFGSLYGYIIQRSLMVISAFAGMYLLLNKFINPLKQEIDYIINLGVAIGYATLPFWPFGLFSVAGLPFLTFAFLNLYKGENKILSYLILILMPFYSSLIASGFFFLLTVTVLWIVNGFKKKKLNYGVFLGLTVLSFFYIIANYRLFETFIFDSSYISHRTEYVVSRSLRGSYYELKDLMFGAGSPHAYSLKDVFIIPVVFLSILILIENASIKKYKTFKIVLVLIIVTSLVNIIFYMDLIKSIMNLHRFDWLHPCMWFVLLAVGLKIIYDYFTQKGKLIVIGILLMQIAYNFRMHEFVKNISTPSFKQYFAQDQFKKIRSFIGDRSDTYKVGSVGLNTTIALFNGFKCVDAYLADYSLQYKGTFRKVIASELDKDPVFRTNFDVWGCRLYLFSSKIGSELGHSSKISGIGKTPIPVYFDLVALQDLGCNYLFSAYQLDFKDNRVKPKMMGIFKDENSAWDIYLYKIPDSQQILKSSL